MTRSALTLNEVSRMYSFELDPPVIEINPCLGLTLLLVFGLTLVLVLKYTLGQITPMGFEISISVKNDIVVL